MPASRDTRLRFQGPPGRLTARVDLPRSRGAKPQVRVGETTFALRVAGLAGRIAALAFAMPAATAPGELDARVEIGGETLKALVEVGSSMLAKVEPAELVLEAAAGDMVTATVDVVNAGNVTLPLSVAEKVTVRAAGAVARGVQTAFKNERGDLGSKLVALGNHIAAEANFDLSVAAAGGKTLDVGARAQLELTFVVPDGVSDNTPAGGRADALQPGSTWTGRLALSGSVIPVTLKAAGEPEKPADYVKQGER